MFWSTSNLVAPSYQALIQIRASTGILSCFANFVNGFFRTTYFCCAFVWHCKKVYGFTFCCGFTPWITHAHCLVTQVNHSPLKESKDFMIFAKDMASQPPRTFPLPGCHPHPCFPPPQQQHRYLTSTHTKEPSQGKCSPHDQMPIFQVRC